MAAVEPAGGDSPTPASLSAAARSAYRDRLSLLTLMQEYRPYICPFELMIDLVPAGSRVLDVGCGGGLFLNLLGMTGRLAETPRAGVGFDVAGPAIELANAAADRVGLGDRLAFTRLDVNEPWPEGPFDVVSIVDVMHHVPPVAQRSVIEHAASRLRPGGLLLYKDMCRRPCWRAWANRMHDLVMARQWIRYAPIDSVAAWAESAGLAVRTRGSANRLWYGHEWIVAHRPAEPGA